VTTPSETLAAGQFERPLDAAAVHQAHADFVWKSLFRLGVREADMEDMLQEVFLVVHRRLNSYDGSSRVTTWLFGICMKVASDYRRRAHRRREQVLQDGMDSMATSDQPSPEDAAATQQARAVLDRILDGMDLDKRAVFVPCNEIAGVMGVPVGTVYSRLHAARRAFEDALARQNAPQSRGGRR
jgi:RNA polymerase sigma-70 factor (ECF subfamily)